jgi:hypothetical protein
MLLATTLPALDGVYDASCGHVRLAAASCRVEKASAAVFQLQLEYAHRLDRRRRCSRLGAADDSIGGGRLLPRHGGTRSPKQPHWIGMRCDERQQTVVIMLAATLPALHGVNDANCVRRCSLPPAAAPNRSAPPVPAPVGNPGVLHSPASEMCRAANAFVTK